MKKILPLSILLTLSACGGGSGDSGPTPTPQPPPVSGQAFASIGQDNGITFFGDREGAAGDQVALVAIPTNAVKLVDIQWEQISGPSIESTAMHTNTLAFAVPQSGTYEFAITARTCSNERDSSCTNQSVTANISFDTISTGQQAKLRLDHAAVEGGRVSLRVDPIAGKTISDVTWDMEGQTLPDSSAVEEQDNRLFFTAPRVEQDSAIRIEAQVRYSDGTTGTDYAYIAVRKSEIDLDDGYFPRYAGNIVTENMFAYRPNSPYATAIERCVYTNQIASACRFSELPLIGMETMNPDIDDILNRTLVSHQWMGERFEQYLRDSVVGQDMLNLLRGVTAVVISYEVRPSFYWAVTGAIYLDADNFWVTPLERDTLNEAPDYRAGFGAELQFIMPWRYVKNNDYYPAGSYPIAERSSRSFVDLEGDISWLMYHELGHANDFFAPSTWASLNGSETPLSVINGERDPDSDALDNTLPLRSSQMKALAQVNFGGEDATEAQRNTTANDVAAEFTTDGATGFYNYYTTREDYASLFEKFMMKYRLDADSDIAVTASRDIDPDLSVVWGERNRFNAAEVQPRVAFTVERIYPELDPRAIQDTLPQPQAMIVGRSWWDNLDLSTPRSAKNNAFSPLMDKDARLQRDLTRRHGKELPIPHSH